MDLSLAHIVVLLQSYGYVLLFPIAVFEGPIITIIAGFLVAQGIFNGVLVYVVVVVADLAGDILYYAIGRWGTRYVARWGSYVGLTNERLSYLEQHFGMHGGRTLLFGKLTHSVGSAILVAAGVAAMPIGRFVWYNVLGTLPKSLVFVLIGYFVGSAYTQINAYLTRAVLIIFVLIVCGGIFWFAYTRRDDATS